MLGEECQSAETVFLIIDSQACIYPLTLDDFH